MLLLTRKNLPHWPIPLLRSPVASETFYKQPIRTMTTIDCCSRLPPLRLHVDLGLGEQRRFPMRQFFHQGCYSGGDVPFDLRMIDFDTIDALFVRADRVAQFR